MAYLKTGRAKGKVVWRCVETLKALAKKYNLEVVGLPIQ
jgi:hypothetical protein